VRGREARRWGGRFVFLPTESEQRKLSPSLLSLSTFFLSLSLLPRPLWSGPVFFDASVGGVDINTSWMGMKFFFLSFS
jgi:hypothetical protein